jgi:hypothetical protein
MVDKFTFEGCERPRVQLVGKDGSIFAILGRCRAASRKVWDKTQWKQFESEFWACEHKDDGYSLALRVVVKYFDLIDPYDEDDDEFEDDE